VVGGVAVGQLGVLGPLDEQVQVVLPCEPDCAEHLVRERGVIVHPGSFYGMAESSRIVVSLIVPSDDFAASIQMATT